MTISVHTQSALVTQQDQVTLTDRSGAHVELTLLIGKEPPIHHAFAFSEGSVTVPLPNLRMGKHKCSLVIQSFKHKLSLNRHYDVRCEVGATVAATAVGDIPSARTNDVGVGDFVITVQ